MDKKRVEQFRRTIWSFYKKNHRSFPWRKTKDPYKILVSEIMLQQTQADRVVVYYEKFIKKFPDFKTLSKANFKDIYQIWQGLGYNRRALALQKLAKEVTAKHHGKLPKDIVLLEELPGIGPYTARAVSIFAYNRPLACIETNIRRAYIHHFFKDADIVTDEEIIPLLEKALPKNKSREWHWALMDYGAYLKTKVENPNRKHKNYSIQSKFEGSLRQIRGAILKNLSDKRLTLVELTKIIKKDKKKIISVLLVMKKEGFIGYKNKKYYLV